MAWRSGRGKNKAMQSASLIIVNFNSEAHTLAALALLASRPDELPGQLIVVDNSPGNGLSRRLEDLDLRVAYIPSGRNLGFAAGVNLGLEHSTGRYVILLNPDARPEPHCLSGLVMVLAGQPDIAVAGPVLLPFEEGMVPVPSATRRDPSLLTALIEYTALHRLMPRDWLRNRYFVMPGAETEPFDCAMVQGACFTFRRDWQKRAGPFDADRFFLYWEETDFCRRVRKLGGRVVCCPQLRCRHQGGASTAGGEQDIHHFWRSLYAYHRKHGGPLTPLMLRLLLIPGMATELLILRLLSRFRRRGDVQLERHIDRQQALLIEQFHSGRRQDTIKA